MNLTIKIYSIIFHLILILININTSYSQDSSRINIPFIVDQNEGKRNITFSDIVKMREPQEVAISPDGKTAAFIIKQAFVDINIHKYALYVIKTTPGNLPVKLVEDASLSSLKWYPNRNYLTYLGVNNGFSQIFSIKPIQGSKPEILFEHKDKRDPSKVANVQQYQISRDGNLIVFTSMLSPEVNKIKKVENDGIIFEDGKHTIVDLMNNSWIKKPQELWKYDINKKKETLIMEFNETIINDFQISPNSRKIAISHLVEPTYQETIIYGNMDISILDIEKKTLTTLVTGEAHQANATWSPDGKFIAYINFLDTQRSSISVVDISTKVIKEYGKGYLLFGYNIKWSSDQSSMFVLSRTSSVKKIGRKILYKISLNNGEYHPLFNNDYRISSFSFNEDNTMAACIIQDPTTPPELAIININEGSFKTITSLNPEYGNITKGNIEELIWENEYGDTTNGYLIKPNNYQREKKYPFLMIHYGFLGKFISDAEWMTIYPVLVFAQNDFVVLLMNSPRTPSWKGNDYKSGSVAEGFSALSSMKTIIEKLSTDGIIDPTKSGVMGVSQGCFLSEFAITQSTLFQVASVSNGGNFNPGVYWLADINFRRYQEKVLGGPPFGETLKNWAEFSPVFNSYKVKSPVLMQFSQAEAIYGMDFFTSLKSNNVPVEFKIFPNEAHIIYQPIHRLKAMEENLDWFTFWLKGEEDPDSAKKEQYKRWRKLREQYEILKNK